MTFDSEEIRKEREYGWFREHERDLIENARRRRIEAEEARTAAASAAERAAHLGRCPRDGTSMRTEMIADVEVDRCPTCEGIFFDRGELETILLRHDEQRKGFFRKLLGFHESQAEKPKGL